MEWETAVNVANVLGIRAICMFNDHRERLVQSRAAKLGSDHPALRPVQRDGES
jgi:hypothetical protein